MNNKNALILAAGKSTHFSPFTYEKPKGLFRVKGEILIERQIEQLREAGVEEINVVGYMKEKFFYLEQKYPGLKLIVNNEFSKKGNLYTVYMAREYLKDTFICCAYMNSSFSSSFRNFMESEINDFGVSSMFWKEFYGRHIYNLTFCCREFEPGQILEFESVDDLRSFDFEFLFNVDSEIIENITKTLNCQLNDISNITVINAGLTNVSFGIDVTGVRYVYRHPGGTAGNLINRRAELFAQFAAWDIGIDKFVIDMALEGWKISYFVKNPRNCDFEKNEAQLICGMEMLHQLHAVPVPELAGVKIFDIDAEAKKLMKIASSAKGHLVREFKPLIDKIDRLYPAVKADAKRLSYGLVLCHNDTYEPNYLYDDKGEMFLIDWEYAGINYAVNDIGCILCRYDWTDKQIARYLQYYVRRGLTEDEKRFCYGFIPISVFYWFGWGLYKGFVGDEDSFFFLPAYRNLVRFIDKALASYGLSVKE